MIRNNRFLALTLALVAGLALAFMLVFVPAYATASASPESVILYAAPHAFGERRL